MAIQFSNLASSLLASGVSDTATSISVNSAASFPTLESGDYFYATIGVGSSSEIVKVTAISGTTFTVLRGQDDTTAVSHSSGADIALRVNAGALLDLRNAGQTYTAGSGLSVSDNEFTNTAPDQTVSITGSGSTSVTGTYPNFTVASTSYSHPTAHPISFITGLQSALDGKVDDSQVLTNVPENAVFTDNNTTYSVGDGGLTEKNFTAALKTKLDGVEASADVTDTANVVAALTAGTNVAIAVDGTISSTDTNTTYSVGDGGLTQKNFTATLKTKLDGIAESANNYSLPFTDNSANWNTAYGWGDHSTEGYLTSHQSLSGYATETYVGTQISNLVDSSPATMDTLNELAAALGDDPNFATTVSTSIGTKLPKAGGTMTGAITFASGQEFDGRDVSVDGTKLDGIAENANNYSHPSAHSISFITGLQTALDGKVDDSQVLTDVPSGAVFTDTTYSVQDGQLSQNNFTNADHTKLNGIESGATQDQTSAEIRALVESASDSNVFTDADHTKLNNAGTQSVVTTAPTSASGYANGHVWYVVG